jgi:predicted O-linked N-acetylglucosamine transferase (SPINDLY family)
MLVRGEPTRAAHFFERALKFKPDYAPALDNLGRVRKSQGRASEAIGLHRRALAAGAGAATASNLLYTLNLVPGISPEEIFAEHQRWGAAQPGALPLPPRPAAAFRRRIRVGYVSPDFCQHAVAYFMESVLAGHDRARFEVFCYSDVRVPDPTTARLRALGEHWRDISTLKDDAVLNQIRGDEIDILVDLAGHTARNRLAVFARRAAPAQVTWIGYPNTTGLKTMDYRITDAIADPVGQTERWHTEQLLRLPGPFSLYRPPADAPEVFSPLPATLRRCVTFGCFNHLAKLHPATIEVWGRILTRLPTAKLMLKIRGVDQATRQRLFAALEERGVPEERVEIISSALSVRDHLTLYGRVDIGLDSFPYNGTTTTCEALWMGVPMVTLAGQTHVARVGASILSHVGFFEGIATTVDDYVERAVGLAADLQTLANIRAGLRERVRSSSLVDQRAFVTALEAAWGQIAKK